MDFKAEFAHCETIGQAKKVYWQLAKAYHPDRGGSDEMMKALNNAFNDFKPGSEAGGEGNATFYDFQGSQDFITIVSKLMAIADDCTVEVIGSWIWVSGDTFPFKEQIKAATADSDHFKAKFSRNKSCWYIAPINYRKKSKKQYSLSELRDEFGSQKVSGNGSNRIKGNQ